MFKKYCFWGILLIMLSGACFGSEKWLTDFEAAKKQAEAEHKVILMDFTGSDWCGWCMKLEKDVFETSQFKSYASKNLILLRVDFPHQKELPAKQKEQNELLAKTYKANGFPSVIFVDSQGTKLGEIHGYKEGGPKNYISLMEPILAAKQAPAN